MRTVVAVLGIMLIIPSALAGGTGPECKDRKARAAGKKAAALLRAFGKNAKAPNATKLATDVSKAQSKFSSSFGKAESKGGCLTAGDVGLIEAKVDALVSEVVVSVSGITTTTTTTLPPGACNVGSDPPCAGTCANSGTCLSTFGNCICTASECDAVELTDPSLLVCRGNCSISGGTCGCSEPGLCFLPACPPMGECPPGLSCVAVMGFPHYICADFGALGCITDTDCNGAFCICPSCMCQ